MIAALAAEARTLPHTAGTLLGSDTFALTVSGPGRTAATAAGERLLAGGCDALLAWGLAGGLAPHTRSGDLIIATAAQAIDTPPVICDARLNAHLLAALAPLEALAAPLLTVTLPVARVADKAELHRRHGCHAVDMESSALARLAQQRGVPFAAVRAIVDAADLELPRAALAGMTTDGATRPLAVLGQLARRPHEMPAMLGLALHYRTALARLRAAAARVCR